MVRFLIPRCITAALQVAVICCQAQSPTPPDVLVAAPAAATWAGMPAAN